jgi:fucose 4-O-acetylase-like acetyltransferase
MSNLPYSLYSKVDFWHDGPLLIFIKLGILLMLLSFSYVWNLGLKEGQWSLVRQFGVTSLLVYWVHVELVYGKSLWFFKENLTLPQTVAAAIGVTFFMLGVSLLRTNWATVREWVRTRALPSWSAGAAAQPEASEASGD